MNHKTRLVLLFTWSFISVLNAVFMQPLFQKIIWGSVALIAFILAITLEEAEVSKDD